MVVVEAGVEVGVVLDVAVDGLAVVEVGLWVDVDAGVAVDEVVLPFTVVSTLIGTLIMGACATARARLHVFHAQVAHAGAG